MSHKELLVQDIRMLVKHITGFDDNDENLIKCENYALSNILNHRYLTIESQNVRKSMEGIISKFFVNGHLQASKRLAELVEKFIKNEKFEDPSHRDEQWAILSLLLNLAHNPTNNLPLNEQPESIKESDGNDDNFDWGSYLMDGIEPFTSPYNDDSDGSLGFSDLEDSGIEAVDEEITPQNVLSIESLKSTERECRNEELVKLVNKTIEAEKWLKENIQTCWWITGDLPDEVHSKHPCANLANVWEEHSLTDRKNDYCRQRILKISEYKVMREVLFMLHSPAVSFLFPLENGRFVVRNDVTIPSLTKDATNNYLSNISEYINIVYELRSFCDEVYASYERTSCENKKLPFTFEVYASVLHEFLLEICCFISSIEEGIRKQDDINTLHSLICKLSPKLKELKVVYDTHVEATKDWKGSPNWLAVTRLLSVLYRTGMSSIEDYEQRNLLKLFLKSFRPYFDIISCWLTEGQFEDWRNEFIIARNDSIQHGTWEMWEKEFTLHPYADSLTSCGIDPLPLLDDVAQKVLHAGKSIALLKKLNKDGDFSHLGEVKDTFYKEFLADIIKQLPVSKSEEQKSSNDKTNLVENFEPSSPVNENETEYAENMEMNPSEHKVLLKHLLPAKILENYSPNEQQSKWCDTSQEAEQEVINELIEKLSCSCFPIKPVMECIFGNLIQEKHGKACSLLKNVLHSQYNILKQLSAVRNIFLMEESDMEKFCSHIFTEVEKNYAWANAYVLTSELENCIDERYPSMSSKFSVSVSETSQTVLSLDTFDSIELNYSVEWPMTLIFTKENMKTYNTVFRFLLKVKWAQWALLQLRFTRGEKKELVTSGAASIVRKRNLLWLLRFWMLHSVSCLHSYLVGEVLLSLGLELERDIDEAADLDTIITVHNAYVQKVHTHCLQPKDYESIRQGVLQLVMLSLKLREIWLVGLEIVSEERLSKMADAYIKCHCHLGSVLQNAVEVSHDRHLTHLSDAINSTPPQKELQDRRM